MIRQPFQSQRITCAWVTAVTACERDQTGWVNVTQREWAKAGRGGGLQTCASPLTKRPPAPRARRRCLRRRRRLALPWSQTQTLVLQALTPAAPPPVLERRKGAQSVNTPTVYTHGWDFWPAFSLTCSLSEWFPLTSRCKQITKTLLYPLYPHQPQRL